MQKRANKGASYTDRFFQKGSVSDAKPTRGAADGSKVGSKKGGAAPASSRGGGAESEGKISIFMNIDDIPDCDAFEKSTLSPRKPASSSKPGEAPNSGFNGERHSSGVSMSYNTGQQTRRGVVDYSTNQSFEVNEWGKDNDFGFHVPQDVAPMAKAALAVGGGSSIRQQQCGSKPNVQQRVVVNKEVPPPLLQPQRIPNLPSFRQPLAADTGGASAAPSGRGNYSGGSYRSTPQGDDAQQSFNPSNDYTPFRYMDSSSNIGNVASSYIKKTSSGMQARPQQKHSAPSGGRPMQQSACKKDDDDDWSDNDVNDVAGRDTPAHYDSYDDYQNYGHGGGYEDDGYATGKAANQPSIGAKAPARRQQQQQQAQYSNVISSGTNQGSKRQFNLDNKLAAGRHGIQRSSHHSLPTPPLEVPALPCEADSARSELSPTDKLAYSRQPRDVEYRPYTLQQYKIIKPKEYVEISNLKPDLNTDELRAKRANLERIKEFSKNLKSFNEKMIESQPRKPPTSSEASAMEISKKKEDSTRARALQFARNIPRPKVVQRVEEYEELEDGYMRGSDEQFGMDRDKARVLMDLEAKYADGKRNVEAIKKAMTGGY